MSVTIRSPRPATTALPAIPMTQALRRALDRADGNAAADLLFLEAWEASPMPLVGATLRAHQIRRANPALAEEIRAEITASRRRHAA